VDGDSGDVRERIARLKIDERDRKLAMLEKQYSKLCKEAEEKSGEAKARSEEMVRQVYARIKDLCNDLAARRDRRETLLRQQQARQG
jgi:hypothetical protein